MEVFSDFSFFVFSVCQNFSSHAITERQLLYDTGFCFNTNLLLFYVESMVLVWWPDGELLPVYYSA